MGATRHVCPTCARKQQLPIYQFRQPCQVCCCDAVEWLRAQPSIPASSDHIKTADAYKAWFIEVVAASCETKLTLCDMCAHPQARGELQLNFQQRRLPLTS
eukprot:1947559-Amphidinium_carterae.1